MSNPPVWQYDEMKQVGKDYGNMAEVERYDSRHGNFRDLADECKYVLDQLNVGKGDVLLDMGAGTGTFAVEAAKRCSKVFAVDVSRAMIEYAKKKADADGASNIVFRHGGFLTYSHQSDPVDVIVTSLALHHLPDLWKLAALNRMNAMLKAEGRLYLMDVVFSDVDYEKNIAKWIDSLECAAGPAMAEDARAHVKNEYSTFTWIMEGLLSRAGFRIDLLSYQGGALARYFCTKVRSCG